jgi:ectoine hydroxylase-related dioxygenase (phytanoyl-CoA dioxygenase family)
VGRTLVGRRGLEPLTPCASCKCATNCANGPSTQSLPLGQFGPGSSAALPQRSRRAVPTIEVVTSNGNKLDADNSSITPPPDLDAHLTRIAEDGYTILLDVIEPELVDEIDEALLNLEHDLGTAPADNLFEGVRTMRVYNLLVHGTTFEKIPVHPNVLPVVEGVLDPGLLISSLSSIAIGPDEQAQPVHADDQLIPLTRPHVPIICNTMWAITDFTALNGATRLVPGSHLRDEAPNPLELYETIPAEMPKGSVLVWVGSLWHGGGANRTDTRRVGIAMNYCAGYIRQQENQQLGIPPALVKTFPRRLQELIGYSVYNGLVGHIDKKHPAKVVLAENEGVEMVWDLLKT